MGEGGLVTTGDGELARKLRLARNHGIEREPSRFVSPDLALDWDGSVNPWYYEMQSIGFNYRASAIHFAPWGSVNFASFSISLPVAVPWHPATIRFFSHWRRS